MVNYKVNGIVIFGYVKYIYFNVVFIIIDFFVGEYILIVFGIKDFVGFSIVVVEIKFIIVEDIIVLEIIKIIINDFKKVVVEFNELVKFVFSVY